LNWLNSNLDQYHPNLSTVLSLFVDNMELKANLTTIF